MRVLGPTGKNILPKYKRTQALLAYLCLSRGERLSRSSVASVIWDLSGEAQARDNLRHGLHELETAGASWRLEKDFSTVRLDTTDCWIDAFESPRPADFLLRGLYGTSSEFDRWLTGERVRFERRWQAIFERKLDDLVAQSAPPKSRAAAAGELLNVVPTYQPALRALMTAFVDMDEPAEAIREFERFKLTTGPDEVLSAKTLALVETIRVRTRKKPTVALNEAVPDQPATNALAPPSCDTRGLTRSGSVSVRAFEPSIAVLPFQDLSARKGRAYVAEGLAEDLVEAISRVPGLLVISRRSAGAFRKQDRSPREIGEALGVRYVLFGSLRIIGDRLRLNVELTDTSSDTPLWRSAFDQKNSDLMEMQNGLAEKVVWTVVPHLRIAEAKRVRIKRPQDYNAYELFLRAQECMNHPSQMEFESAEDLLKQGIRHEPRYATALAWLAHWHVLRVGQGYSLDPAYDTTQADQFANQAVECDASEPLAIAVQGHIAAYLHRDFDQALERFDIALRINPSAARVWLWRAYTHSWMVEGVRAVEDINRAMSLSPYDPLAFVYSGGASIAYIADGQYERAIEFSLRCIRENRTYTTGYKSLIVAYVLLGRETDARGPANLLRLLEPGFTVEQFRRRSPAFAGPRGELYCEAFATAGVPLSG
jgi:TolB-like protein/DNA-binding SARP family transcriptional activator